jgi:hypothetical protein
MTQRRDYSAELAVAYAKYAGASEAARVIHQQWITALGTDGRELVGLTAAVNAITELLANLTEQRNALWTAQRRQWARKRRARDTASDPSVVI